MMISLAEAMRDIGHNYQRHLHVTAIDIDPRAIHMAYIQFSLLHIPAHLMVGNALSGEIQDHWFAPAHIWGDGPLGSPFANVGDLWLRSPNARPSRPARLHHRKAPFRHCTNHGHRSDRCRDS